MQKLLLQPILLLCTLSVLAQPTPELVKDIIVGSREVCLGFLGQWF